MQTVNSLKELSTLQRDARPQAEVSAVHRLLVALFDEYGGQKRTGLGGNGVMKKEQVEWSEAQGGESGAREDQKRTWKRTPRKRGSIDSLLSSFLSLVYAKAERHELTEQQQISNSDVGIRATSISLVDKICGENFYRPKYLTVYRGNCAPGAPQSQVFSTDPHQSEDQTRYAHICYVSSINHIHVDSCPADYAFVATILCWTSASLRGAPYQCLLLLRVLVDRG